MIKQLLYLMLLMFAGLNYTNAQQEYYLGTGQSGDVQGTSCASCHTQGNIGNPIYDDWKLTKHAFAQDSLNNPFYTYDCLRCHNTGWDPNVTNYGADEYVVKDTSKTPNYVITDLAKFNRVKNVGCEACHGPAGNSDGTIGQKHWTDYAPSYAAENCAQCHGEAHHPYMSEWQTSAHSKSVNTAFVVSNKACVKCHVAQNFIMYAKNPAAYRDTLLVPTAENQPITCQTCHDPHSNKNTAQLRFPLTHAKTICDECHNTELVDSVDINVLPHHTTSEVLSGSNLFGYRYAGQTYINSAHTYAVPNRCVDCHVVAEPFNGIAASTGHTFQPKVQACRTCHSDYYAVVDTSNPAKKFDYRGVQTTMDSLISVLTIKLNKANHNDSATVAFKEADYNLQSVIQEGSHGVHNFRLTRKLLQDAIANFTPTGVGREESSIPSSYTLSQNYPNPFNPTTNIKFSIPVSGNVKITVYDATGSVIANLVNKYFSAGNYTVEWNASRYSSGVYFYRIETNNFSMVKKMILMK